VLVGPINKLLAAEASTLIDLKSLGVPKVADPFALQGVYGVGGGLAVHDSRCLVLAGNVDHVGHRRASGLQGYLEEVHLNCAVEGGLLDDSRLRNLIWPSSG